MDTAQRNSIFGLYDREDEAQVHFIPVEWDATTSYRRDARNGPGLILKESNQVDLYDHRVESPETPGFFWTPCPPKIRSLNEKTRELYEKHIQSPTPSALEEANRNCEHLNEHVYEKTSAILSSNKTPGIVGGDHSVSFGAIKAASEKYSNLGILHIDAHLDLRLAYQGFTYSHASIIRNVSTRLDSVTKIAQIGIRDCCEEEIDYLESQGDRFMTVFDENMQDDKAINSLSLYNKATEIAAFLPNDVWITFDIDGLDPVLCPGTGTPVPGGLSFHEAKTIIFALVKSGKKIRGFDLVEVAANENTDPEWNGNVGMRMLYILSAYTLASQGLCRLRL